MLSLLIQINNFWLAFLFLTFLVESSILSTVFMIFVRCGYVCLQLQHPLYVCLFLFSFSVCFSSCFPSLFTFLYCLTVFLCLAAPCALTSHLWSAVCPMCHITLARTFVFGSFSYLFSFFLYSHDMYSINFLAFFCVCFYFPYTLWFFLFSWCMNIEVFLPECLVPL